MENWNRTDIKESLIVILAMLNGNSHDVPAMIRSEFPKFQPSNLLKSSAKIDPGAAKVNG